MHPLIVQMFTSKCNNGPISDKRDNMEVFTTSFDIMSTYV